MGITDGNHIEMLTSAIAKLPAKLSRKSSSYNLPDNVDEWLQSIKLPQYCETFRKNGFGEMERVRKMWEVELTTVLEVTRLGHRRRILASLGDRPIEPDFPRTLDAHDLSLELSKLVS